MSLVEFLNQMVKDCNKRNQFWSAEFHQELIALLSNMKWDVAHSHLMKMVRDLTQEMEQCENCIDPNHGVAWGKRLIAEQTIKFMEGKLTLN